MNLLILYLYPVQLVLNFIIGWIEGQVDGATVLRGRWPEHKFSAFVRVATNTALIYFVNHKVLEYNFMDCLLTLIPSLALYWMAIDASINLKRGKDLFYIGKTAKTDKAIRWLSDKLDKLSPGSGIDGEHVIIFKLFLVILSVVIFFNF